MSGQRRTVTTKDCLASDAENVDDYLNVSVNIRQKAREMNVQEDRMTPTPGGIEYIDVGKSDDSVISEASLKADQWHAYYDSQAREVRISQGPNVTPGAFNRLYMHSKDCCTGNDSGVGGSTVHASPAPVGNNMQYNTHGMSYSEIYQRTHQVKMLKKGLSKAH